MIAPAAAQLAQVHHRVRARQYGFCATCYEESTKELALLIPYTDDTLREFGADVLMHPMNARAVCSRACAEYWSLAEKPYSRGLLAAEIRAEIRRTFT